MDERIRELEGEISELEHERAEIEARPVPSWDELRNSGVVEELQKRDMRKTLLGLLLPAARRKVLRLRLQRERAKREVLVERSAEARERVDAAVEKRHEAEKEQRLAGWASQNVFNELYAVVRRINAIRRELADVGEEAS